MAGVQEYKCPCCGGGIVFNSAVQKMKCPYCDSEFEMEALEAFDEELKKEDGKVDELNWQKPGATQQTWSDSETANLIRYSCNSCGAEVIGDKTLGATSCPYCGNPMVMMEQFKGEMKPDYVIPFKLDKQEAKNRLRQHLQGKKLLPRQFKDANHIDEIKGVYIPFWLYDAECNANARYKATKVRTWADSRNTYTNTSVFSVVRSGVMHFEHVPVDASTKFDDELMEAIEPYNFKDLVDFQTAYLSGYLADKYDVDSDRSMGRVNQRVKNSAEIALRNTVSGYSSVNSEHTSVQVKNSSVKYALLPVWILTTTWNGKPYIFAMNGQTGKFVGDLPEDKSIATNYFIRTTLAVTLVGGLLRMLLALL